MNNRYRVCLHLLGEDMTIEHILGTNGISDFRGERRHAPSFELAHAETWLFEYLSQTYNLSGARAVHLLAVINASGEDLVELVLELQQGSDTAIARIEAFVAQVG